MERLRLDRRLIRRRGWIAPEELDRELEQLPDVTHKAAMPDEGEPPQPVEDAGGA